MIFQGTNIPSHLQGPMHKKMKECPNIENHLYGPEPYNEWHEWARKMGRTHNQFPCKSCGFFVIWEAKP